MVLDVSFHPTTTTLRLPAACAAANGTSTEFVYTNKLGLLLTCTKLACPAARTGSRSDMNVTANPDRLGKSFRSFSYAKFTFTKLASWMTGVLAGASLGGPLLPAVAVIETADGQLPCKVKFRRPGHFRDQVHIQKNYRKMGRDRLHWAP